MGRRAFLATAGAAVSAAAMAGAEPDREGSLPSEDDVRPVVAFLEQEVEAGSIPGAFLAASLHGRPFLDTCVGTYTGTDGTVRPCTSGVSSILYSFSKVVSATVIATVCQEGRVELDAPVRRYIPEFTGGGKDEITLRHLLTHAAGIPSVRVGSADTPEKWQANVDALCEATVEWAPGSRTAYHGVTGLFLAAAVVCRVCDDVPWETLCRERLFQHLGDCQFTFRVPSAGPDAAFAPPNFASLEDCPFANLPPAGAFGTVQDMVALLNMHFDGTWEGRTILEPAMLAEMHRIQYADAIAAARREGKTPVHETWGLGWLIRGEEKETEAYDWFGLRHWGPRAYGHAGIDTVMGNADPDTGVALAFIATASPKSESETRRIRNEVSRRVLEAAASVRRSP